MVFRVDQGRISGWIPKILLGFLLIMIFGFDGYPQVKDQFYPLPANSVHLQGYLEDYIQNSLVHWNKGVVPYSGFVKNFRNGRTYFAQGEMWGKAVRSGCMFYRYTQDPELKKMLQATVSDLLTTRRANGSISCSEVASQPDGPKGDLWERKYVLLGLDEFYNQVEKNPDVLKAMIDQADCILAQIGPAPKVPITEQGWSKNRLESCSLLEPIMRLYKLTESQRYLDFAKYIVEVEGGAKGFNVIEQAFGNTDPWKMGGTWPKAYEMTSLFEGLVEYYRVTGNEHWKQSFMNLYRNIKTKEITIIGNGGSDQPYHPDMYGEGWGNSAAEQTNPDIKRTMETCVGVTWMKFCSQILRLTGDPTAVDDIEKYIYNGLIGALKPSGDRFSYFSWLNGVKANPKGWGGTTDGVMVTCCTLNGPMGLAYIPYIAVMNSNQGPVVNLYNAGTSTVMTPKSQEVQLSIVTDYPKTGLVVLTVKPQQAEKFSIRIRIPAWSTTSTVKVNGKTVKALPGTYCEMDRIWSSGDKVVLNLDMRCRLIQAPHGSNRAGDNFQALIRGPIVLSRDENIDSGYSQPVSIQSKNGYVKIVAENPLLQNTRLQFSVPTTGGVIHMVDYASVNGWEGKHICTWLPTKNN